MDFPFLTCRNHPFSLTCSLIIPPLLLYYDHLIFTSSSIWDYMGGSYIYIHNIPMECNDFYIYLFHSLWSSYSPIYGIPNISQIYPNGHCLNYHLQRPATFALRPHDVAAAGRGPRPFARPAACCAWCFWHVRGTKPRCFHRIYSAKREFNEPNGGIIMQIEWDFTWFCQYK